MSLQASTNHPYLSDHVNYVFFQFTLYLSSFFGIPSKATPGVALEVEQPGIEQLSPGMSKVITELIAISNLTTVRFYSVWFSRKKVCLYLLHVEKDWVDFSAVHKSFNKNGAVRPKFPDYLFVSYDYVHIEKISTFKDKIKYIMRYAVVY